MDPWHELVRARAAQSRRLRAHPVLAVIGPSGSGKSSLVLAGLLPALRKSGLFGAGEWNIRVMRPSGLLVVDNTLSHANQLVEFSELVHEHEAVTSTLVTVGAGVLLVVKSP